MKTLTIITIKDLYPEISFGESDFIELLRSMNLYKTIYGLSLINRELNSELLYSQIQENILNKFKIECIENRLDTFFSLSYKFFSDVGIFNKGQTYELLKWALLFCDDSEESYNNVFTENFFMSLIYSLEVWEEKVYENFQRRYYTQVPFYVEFRKSIEAQSVGKTYRHYFGRIKELMLDDFFDNNFELKIEFEKEHGITIEEFYYSACLFIIANDQNEVGILMESEIEALVKSTKMKKFIDLISLSTIDLKMNVKRSQELCRRTPNSKNTINKLLYRYPVLSNCNKYIVFDSNLLYKIMDQGIVFQFINDHPNVLSKYGYAFERYVNNVFKRMFPDSIMQSTKYIPNHVISCGGKEVEVDGYLEDDTTIVVFEHKAVFLNEEKIMQDEFNGILEHIKSKYVKSGNKLKGVGQLSRVAKSLTMKGLDKNIISVLLVRDEFLAAPTFQYFLSDEFRKISFSIDYENNYIMQDSVRVYRPIIMTLEDLEILENSTKKFSLQELLIEYVNSREYQESFSNFLANYKEQIDLHANELLIAGGIEMIQESKRFFYGSI
jgi:hypothetical protein